MTRDELYQYLQKPETMSKETIPIFEKLVEAYPYAGGIVFLYLYNLKMMEDIRYPSELRRLAIRLPNRRLLYGLAEENIPYTPTSLPKNNSESSFSLVEQFLDELPYSPDASLALSGETPLSEDYFSSLGYDTENLNPSENLSEYSLKNIVSGDYPSKNDTKDTKSLERKGNTSTAKGEEAKNDKEEWGDALFTETLGRIYAKQHCYEKALAVFQAIKSKNSEKSAYFAEQIEYLQILIENKKVEQS